LCAYLRAQAYGALWILCGGFGCRISKQVIESIECGLGCGRGSIVGY
jgi:hypothetical protein